MRFISIFSGVLISTLACGLAVAADIDDQAAARQSWSGFYVGGFTGYHAGDVENSDCTGICPTDPKFKTWGVGIQAGYDHEFANRVVLGGYAMIPLASSQDSFTLAPFGAYTYKAKLAGFIGARLGYDMNNGWLPYVAGGYNFARIEANNGTFSQTNTHHGFHLSLGAEHMWTDKISTDFRYTYSQLGKETYNPGVASTWGEKANAFTVGVNYRF